MMPPEPSFTVESLKKEGFSGFVTFAALLNGELSRVPTGPGVYVAIRTSRTTPGFSQTSCGGHFKGGDPTVVLAVLRAKWVDDCAVLYIGKGDSLQRRLGEYARFGRGDPIGHWGGRYIWQLADAADLLVAWREAGDGQTAADAEGELAGEFKRRFGALPFANIRDPSRRTWKKGRSSAV
jgi:hypothetical protein